MKVRDHCHITRKHRGSAHRDCNINVKLNHEIHVVFYNLKPYYARTGKLNFKINVIQNRLEKFISFNINNMQSFIVSFQYLRSSLNNLVKNLGITDFKYLSQEFDNDILDLVKKK